MKICVRCKEKFSSEEISEWRTEHEPFSTSPFMCPDCYDAFSRMDLEDQLTALLPEKEAI